MKHSWGIVILSASAAVLLTACGGASPGASPSVSESATATPTASASPSATPSPSPSPSEIFDPHPPVASLHLTTQGLGPLTVGVPPATNPGAAMIEWDPDNCYSVEMGMTEGDLGRWQPAYPDHPFSVDASETGVHRIDVWDPAITTPEGIYIGSTLAQLQAAYPGLVAGTGGITSHVWWIQDSHGTVVFETQGPAMDGSTATAPSDPVVLMRALSTAWGSEIDWGAANSGNVADACF